MLVSTNAKNCVTPNAKHKICVTPNAKPKREPMEYRLRWVPSATFLRWPCTFHLRWLPNANPDCSEILALGLNNTIDSYS